MVPQVVRPLTSNFVLTTEWIEGEKLCESQAADVRELCNTLLTAYLTQLLETGFLHADPHPGARFALFPLPARCAPWLCFGLALA